jgi:hypothetical protein
MVSTAGMPTDRSSSGPPPEPGLHLLPAAWHRMRLHGSRRRAPLNAGRLASGCPFLSPGTGPPSATGCHRSTLRIGVAGYRLGFGPVLRDPGKVEELRATLPLAHYLQLLNAPKVLLMRLSAVGAPELVVDRLGNL